MYISRMQDILGKRAYMHGAGWVDSIHVVSFEIRYVEIMKHMTTTHTHDHVRTRDDTITHDRTQTDIQTYRHTEQGMHDATQQQQRQARPATHACPSPTQCRVRCGGTHACSSPSAVRRVGCRASRLLIAALTGSRTWSTSSSPWRCGWPSSPSAQTPSRTGAFRPPRPSTPSLRPETPRGAAPAPSGP
eukprot:COSAG01_NODE_4630_length_4863_cov_3.556255_3_plen_189_part_00